MSLERNEFEDLQTLVTKLECVALFAVIVVL